MKKFIAGSTIESANNLFIKKFPKWIPIFDYAKEGTFTYEDSKKTFQSIKKDLNWLSNNVTIFPKPAYAIKISSILHYQPYISLSQLINTYSGPIFLDSENDNFKWYEQQYFNPLLKNQSKCTDEPIKIYKTYQMYRKDSYDELVHDIYYYKNLGIKLVRGAYLHQDKNKNILWNSINETHTNYNKALTLLCSEDIHRNTNLSIIFATHNTISISILLENFKKLPDSVKNKIATAQLLGMRDDITNKCLSNSIRVYKYVPYGSLLETYPYLFRRLIENYKILQHVF